MPDATAAQLINPRLAIAAHSTPAVRPLERYPVDVHVRKFVECLKTTFSPGEMIEGQQMIDMYQYVCRQLHWRPLKWNTFAKHLKFSMGLGPGGSPKAYTRGPDENGTERPRRVWYMPRPGEAVRQPTPKALAVAPQSTPVVERRAA